ncbi:MAG: hypothetical protein EPO09_21495 [Aquabacterium sp.]|uniref:hypothetical protein n=1 Tax=Aquabacterium sp. TaxID=1872578 RepID=UPI00120A1FE2|nr:hypothetical protein [Aquabacterium sp.]TAK82816.1 MAG: hypothetical protein EPO09_21495 [Aquabacterium sp.]
MSTVIAIPTLLLVFGWGAWTAIHFHWSMPIATVNVSNESGREIESIVVTYTTCGQTKKLIYRRTEQHELNSEPTEMPMHFVLCGEGSHSTEVILRGGQTMATKGSYIEGGYAINVHVTASGIKSEYQYALP